MFYCSFLSHRVSVISIRTHTKSMRIWVLFEFKLQIYWKVYVTGYNRNSVTVNTKECSINVHVLHHTELYPNTSVNQKQNSDSATINCTLNLLIGEFSHFVWHNIKHIHYPIKHKSSTWRLSVAFLLFLPGPLWKPFSSCCIIVIHST